jgi:flagellar basal-body rod protein FlgF
MIRGLYGCGWSMLANSKKMDVISNNLANVNTNGFKKDLAVLKSFPELLTKCIKNNTENKGSSNIVGTMSISSDIDEVFTYYNQGQLNNTENKLDFAIDDTGDSFFTVLIENPDGTRRIRYTRDGAFNINQQNILVTKEGYPVLGEQGIITIQDKDFIVDEKGMIIQDSVITDRFSISSFTDTKTLLKVGSNMVEVSGDTEVKPFDGSVFQGCLELSNVNIIKEMVDMITVLRAYESNQKMIQIQDATLEKAVNEVGIVR